MCSIRSQPDSCCGYRVAGSSMELRCREESKGLIWHHDAISLACRLTSQLSYIRSQWLNWEHNTMIRNEIRIHTIHQALIFFLAAIVTSPVMLLQVFGSLFFFLTEVEAFRHSLDNSRSWRLAFCRWHWGIWLHSCCVLLSSVQMMLPCTVREVVLCWNRELVFQML